jgi:hypothetical protein
MSEKNTEKPPVLANGNIHYIINSKRCVASRKRLTGTEGLSAVGIFGKGQGWGIPVSTYTLCITVGALSEKPAFIDGQTELREHLALTASFDHDIIDGAPATRFVRD